MTGTFQSAQSVTQLKISQFNGFQWNYINWDIDKSYAAGEQAVFSYGLQIPSIVGTYTDTFALYTGTLVPISCWEIQFST